PQPVRWNTVRRFEPGYRRARIGEPCSDGEEGRLHAIEVERARSGPEVRDWEADHRAGFSCERRTHLCRSPITCACTPAVATCPVRISSPGNWQNWPPIPLRCPPTSPIW